LDRQLQIYGAQQPPAFPIAFEVWEERARAILSPPAYGYVAGGAGAEDTMCANRDAFRRRRLRPRMLRGAMDREQGVEVLGAPSTAPFLLAPVGVLSIVHADAELAAARAAAACGVAFILSTVSSHTIEQVAAAMGDAPRWFQLYPGTDRELMASLVRRTEAAGYGALVVTVDTPMLGWRERDLAHAYLPFLQGQGIANYLSDPVFRASLASPPQEDMHAAVMRFLQVFVDPTFSWDGIDYLRGLTSLPMLIKGITHPEDARLAVAHGVNGIVVSNHGGRQVDGAMAALDALPEIRDAVGASPPVLMDSGIRRGADVLKALALGADAVLLGRPYVYGLAVGGEQGVVEVIRNLQADIDLELALCGYRSIKELDASALAHSGPT
jgi:lactate 2-monooxygenase